MPEPVLADILGLGAPEMRYTALFLVALFAGCTPTKEPEDSEPSFLDHEGREIVIRSGFTFVSEESDGDVRFVVLTNAPDGCGALAWWAVRNAALSEMFQDDPFDEEAFIEAIENTGDVWTEEMGAEEFWYLIVGAPESLVNGDAPLEEDDETGFFAYANLISAPVYTSEGSSRSFGEVEYEVTAEGGELTLKTTSDGASGTIETTLESDTLDQFSVKEDFDVPVCTDWVDAFE